MIEVVMKVDEEFWDNITQLTVFKEQKEIVHCKDCKYWSERFEECHIWDGVDVLNIKADDFCSKGVKK